MRKNFKKTTVLFLVIAMLFSLPVNILADENYADTSVTIPQDATLLLTQKDYEGKNYKPFTPLEPAKTVSNEDGTDTYYFEIEEGKVLNVRISGENYITYADRFIKEGAADIVVTREELTIDGKDKKSIDRDVSSNNGYNVADIYLNINPRGFIKMESGDTYQLIPQRTWQAVNSTTENYFTEPDYHYEVIGENGEECDVVSISADGTITAEKEGTAIVLVTYDAFIYPSALLAEETPEFAFFGAIWPENTGVFVVSVDCGESGIETGFTLNEEKNAVGGLKAAGEALDCEHDVIYFTGEKGEFVFEPKTEGCGVFIANPTVEDKMTFHGFEEVIKNDNNTFTLPLTEGRNIVKIVKDDKSEYQIITAKKVSYEINGGEDVYAGDEISIVFDRLYHPINKLDGIYNMSAQPIYTEISGYDGIFAGGEACQYSFAGNEASQNVASEVAPVDNWGVISYEPTKKLTVPADYNQDVFTLKSGAIYASGWGFPGVTHRTLTKDFVGAEGYADALMGTFGRLPDIEIPIKAEADTVEEISVTTLPEKTKYKTGEKFSVSGMVVTAVYKSGKSEITSDYTFKPDGELAKGDTQIEIIYTGNDKGENLQPATVEISVTSPRTNSGSSVIISKQDNNDKQDNSQSKEEGIENSETETSKALLTADTFKDINEADWYYDSVKYVYENGLMKGTEKGFEPFGNMSRAMLAEVLYRIENVQDSTPYKDIFDDVKQGAWYEKSVLWAAENNIVKGISEKAFAPEENVTREQLAVILYRYAQMKGIAGYNEAIYEFEDINDVSDWAQEGIRFATSLNIISGTDNGKLLPAENASRAQVATILMRFSKILCGEELNEN